ncbi:DUF7344 domain-containing protein [Haloarchaeobius amylolyticus]|uniref:DUF7344 domain-containing protein n=1 Tax=Haloarchaeobius amylolyticus TaxID=1198296 RepID=UPI00226DAA71|nr:hypothetical protein [Haloarchaeobius amylolyticus]
MVVADPGDGGPSVTVAQVAGDGTGGTVLTQDTVFHTLSNQRRRLVLEALAEHEQVTVRELTSYVAARECGIDEADLDYKQRKRVYTSLVQTHLPMMQKHDIVAYDKSRGTVEPAADLAAFDVYLEVVPEDELHWSEFYLGLSAVFGILVGLAWLGLAPFASLGGLAYAALFTVALAVTAAVHLRSARQKRLDEQERRSFVEDDDPTR